MTLPQRSPSDTGFWGHVEELRHRAIQSLIVFIIASALFYPCAGAFLSWLVAPAGQLVFLYPSDAFVAHWSVVLFAGFGASLPFIFCQFWLFVAEGLRPAERWFVAIYGISSFVLFVVGALFAYFVMVPMAYSFLLSYATEHIVAMITIDRYLSFVMSFVLAFAFAFELPVVMFILARLRIIRSGAWAEGRRYAIVGVLIMAAVLTPPDVVSQLLLAGPLLLLYEIGIVVARVGERLSGQ